MVSLAAADRATEYIGVDRRAYQLDGVGFSVSGRTLLGPLTLAFEMGRCFGLIGHNGSGKTTLLKLLARQQAPTAGAIRFKGRALAD